MRNRPSSGSTPSVHRIRRQSTYTVVTPKHQHLLSNSSNTIANICFSASKQDRYLLRRSSTQLLVQPSVKQQTSLPLNTPSTPIVAFQSIVVINQADESKQTVAVAQHRESFFKKLLRYVACGSCSKEEKIRNSSAAARQT